MALPFPLLASKLTTLENVDRVIDTDPTGGGSIVRTLYCEPYSAYPIVLTALRGTIVPDPSKRDVGECHAMKRQKPHHDPIQQQFYCTRAMAIPFNRESIRACKSTGFDARNDDGNADYNGQLKATVAALDNIDDFDFANNPDTLTAAEIAGNNLNKPVNNTASTGNCGAFITATYNPLVFAAGDLSPGSNYDPFDYVIRETPWQDETILTQTGRQLFILKKGTIPGTTGYSAGLDDTFAKPEVVWKFRVWRLMVPFLPKFTIDLFTNKINGGTYQAIQYLGGADANSGIPFVVGTARLEDVATEFLQGPDGKTWWNLGFTFAVRKLYDEYFNERTLANEKGWIDWNHHFAIPTYVTAIGMRTGIQFGRARYYPVVWNGGLFQTMGNKHPLFLADTDADMQQIPYVKANGNDLAQGLFKAPFQAGFYANQ